MHFEVSVLGVLLEFKNEPVIISVITQPFPSL